MGHAELDATRFPDTVQGLPRTVVLQSLLFCCVKSPDTGEAHKGQHSSCRGSASWGWSCRSPSTLISLVSRFCDAGAAMDEKAAKMVSAPARPAAVSVFVISSSLLFRPPRGAGGRLMKITLVGQYRMLAERAVDLPFRNQTYVKTADFRGFFTVRG